MNKILAIAAIAFLPSLAMAANANAGSGGQGTHITQSTGSTTDYGSSNSNCVHGKKALKKNAFEANTKC